jgi:alpha-beta hydrolase superfamily lysophospholipase
MQVIKLLGCIFLSGSFFMNATGPFSFKEIDSIEKFNVIEPQFLKASDGVQLAYYSFLNPSNKEIVIFYAGAGLYGNKTYQWVAKMLQEEHGIGCYIFDIRGHGNSGGPRGDAPSIDRVWLDVEQAIEFVKSKNPHSKIYLVGHSSGAGLIINYAAHINKKLEYGYIFLAPYLGPKSNTAKAHQNSSASFIKNVRSWVYILGAMLPNSFITHFKSVFFNYPDDILKADPLILAYYTYTMSCATTPYDIDLLLKKIDKPVGIFIGKNDEQFLPEKVIAYKNLINAPVQTEIIENTAHLSILLQAPKLISDFIARRSI